MAPLPTLSLDGRLSRRAVAGGLAAALGPWRRPARAGAGPAAGAPTGQDAPADVVFLSNQLTPPDETTAIRSMVLAAYPGRVEFVPSDPGPMIERIAAEAAAGEGAGTVGVVGALHGDFAALAAQDLLADLDDLAADLADRRFIAPYLDLARFDGPTLRYLPWMQATYLMAARREALEYLPDGLSEPSLYGGIGYDQLARWAERIAAAEGPRFALPAGPSGLLHRFLQGCAYPSFTGGVTTTFASEAAIPLWEWLRRVWRVALPASLGYDAMAPPLAAGEVWLGWDHTARLIDALRQRPEELVVFPPPRGPRGLGFMPVLAGLAVPKSAPDPGAARALIDFLTRPETQTVTLREVGFFPAIDVELPPDLPAAVQAEAAAVQRTISGDGAFPSLLPVGLGPNQETYNRIFRDAFRAIVVDGGEPAKVLADLAPVLQGTLDAAAARCWPPDPPSAGVCRVRV